MGARRFILAAAGSQVCSPFPRLGQKGWGCGWTAGVHPAPERPQGRKTAPTACLCCWGTNKKKISDCKTIQSLLARFSKMLQWYLNKWSVQRMNHLMWKRSFPNLIFYRHFYKTLKTVFQYHASGAMLRKHQQKCSSDSCWVVLVLLKAMGCVLRISQSQSYSRFTTQQQALGILFVAYVQFGCTL